MTGARRIAGRSAAATVAALGGAALLRRRRRRRHDYRVFVLEYHDVGSSGSEREGVVSAARLARHLRFLQSHFRLTSLSGAVEALAGPKGPGEDLVVITFDDGYAGNYRHAWPVLRAAGVPATVFVASGFLDGGELWFDLAERCLEAARQGAPPEGPIEHEDVARAVRPWLAGKRDAVWTWLKGLSPERRDAVVERLRVAYRPTAERTTALSWAEARELAASGIEIGAHTHSHPILSTLPPARQEQEIIRGRDRIATELGTVPRHFAYPNGSAIDFTDDTVRIVRDAGFRSACTTVRGSNAGGCDLLRLARIGVGNEPTLVLAARLAGLLDDRIRQRLGLVTADAHLAH